MEVLTPYNEDGSEGLASPIVRVQAALGELSLHWLNTRIRLFTNNDQFNHIEYRHEDEQVVGFQNDELFEILYENQFPILELPYVDKATFNWLETQLSKNLDSEIEGLEL